MKKQIFRILFIPFALALVLSSCQDFVGELAKLHIEMLDLEAEVTRINTTTAAIGEIIDDIDNDMITRIDEIMEEGACIGYSIVYQNGRTVCVYHGTDGEKGPDGDDGHNGKNGHSPMISIRQSADGVWYWTVDGLWMTDASGDKVPVAGEEGVTPLLKIEKGRWMISSDGGGSWSDYGEASKSYGNSPILNVDYTTYDEKVLFTLRDGTEFFVPKADTDIRLECNTPSKIKLEEGKTVKIGLKLSGSKQAAMNIDVMAGDMFRWSIRKVSADSCYVSVRATYLATESDLFTIFVNCGRKTWMKVFTFDLSSPQDPYYLSKNGTANCYVVNKAGTFHFDATVKGNSHEPLDGDPSDAKVLWESFGTTVAPSQGSLVRDISFSDGLIYFTVPTPSPTGNAGIAVLDSRGMVLWSWHIWICPDFYPESTEVPFGETIFMDRNLGAVSSDPTSDLSYGLYYVHGRKDPIMGTADNYRKVISTPDSWQTVELTDEQHVYGYFVANPMTFNGNVNHIMREEFYWDKSKSVNDPCPPGWVIPDQFKYDSYSAYEKGYLLTGSNPDETLFLPCAGYNWTWMGTYAEYWLAGQDDGYYHHHKFDGNYARHETTKYDFYYSIRCCRQ